MTVRTCLLVSPDPDDQVEFTEALYEISEDITVLVVPDPRKAADLVLSKRLIPDYIIIDLEINGGHDRFFEKLSKDPAFDKIFIIAYADFSEYEQDKSTRISAFLERDSSYSSIKTFLGKFVGGEQSPG